MLEIKVPASSANIGPGFDSMGMALKRYLTLSIEKSDQWEFTHTSDTVPGVLHYEDHYIYKVANQVAKWHHCTLPPCHIKMHSDIPLARGLGSSASAIVAAIEMVNQLCELNLTEENKFKYAIQIEGHPDNVAPALFGGLVVTVHLEDETFYKQLLGIDTDLVIYIPDYELRTEDARDVLPKTLAMNEATTASSVSNLMISALATGDYALAGKLMERDLFHERYRASLITNYTDIKAHARKFGAYGTVISGAGPTMISFVPAGKGANIAREMQTLYSHYDIEVIEMDETGLVVQQNMTQK